jgi:hypothetical protein
MARFAAQTTVPVDRSRVDIEKTLARYGATSFAYASTKGKAIIAFEAKARNIRITIPLPAGETEKEKQQTRQRWRALLLVIKAKLESVESKIETLEEAFYANIIMPDGRTVYESTCDTVALAYETGRVQKLLPDYRSKQTNQ